MRLGLQGKAVLGLLVVALVPLAVAVLLVAQIGEAAGRVASGEVQRLREPLQRAAGVYRELVDSKKELFARRTTLISYELGLGPCGERALAETAVQRLVDGDASIVRAAILREGALLAERERTPDQAVRPLDLEAGFAEVCTLQVRWGFPARFLDEQQALGDALREHRTLGQITRTLPTSYLLAFAALFGGVVAAVTIVAIWAARRYITRIRQIIAATHAVAEGDLGARARVTGRDELAELGGAFDRMVGELATSRAEIEYLGKIAAWQEVARRLAHEIKNPLTPIQLAVQQLASSYAGDDPRFRKQLRDSVEIVEEEVAGLRRLVDAFSSFAKLPRVEPVPVDLAVVIDDVVQGASGIAVELEPPPSPLVVHGDRLLLRRALTNLVDNAREAGARKVRIDWRVEAGLVRVVLDDDGPGVKGEIRGRIFDPYVTTKEHGTGLGLAIVKKTLLEHGGDIEVAREPSALGGARFVIELPLV
jgi:two-component system nitrogen regulation sensor histidine kinase NtrY